MSHTVIKFEPGVRVIAVEDGSGKLVDTVRDAGVVTRRENGIPLPAPLFEGTETEATGVIDGLATAMGARPAIAVAAAAAASPRRGMHVTLGSTASVVAVLAIVGAMAYHGTGSPPPAAVNPPVQSGWTPPPGLPGTEASLGDDAVIPATVDAPAHQARPGAGARPVGEPPAVALPGTVGPGKVKQSAEAAPATDTNATTVRAEGGPPLKGAGIGLAKQEYAPLTKDATYGSRAPTVVVPQGASKVTLPPAAPEGTASAMATKASPAAAAPATPATVAAIAPATAPAATHETTANVLASKAEAARQDTEAKQAEARKKVTEQGADKAGEDVEKLKGVLDALERGDKIPMAVVSQLPHEIAQKLREAGVVATQEEEALLAKANGGEGYRIVRLPQDVMDRYRDKDGTPTIPASNSWAATGGNVRIPLPGGGEIRTAEDMTKAFHLQN